MIKWDVYDFIFKYFFILECHDKVLDVYFLIDKSASISVPELEVEKKVVRGIINSFDIGELLSKILTIL